MMKILNDNFWLKTSEITLSILAFFSVILNFFLLFQDILNSDISLKTLLSVMVIIILSYQYKLTCDRKKSLELLKQKIEREFVDFPNRAIASFLQSLEAGSIGDVSCDFNACSPYLQCTINPTGDCKICSDYEATRQTKMI